MKRLYFLIYCLLVGAIPAFSQAINCTQTLRMVRTTYEQGRLHELPGLTEACLRGTGGQSFSKEEKKEAYRYLTLSYIYLEEPEKADEMMLQLISLDHFYEPNKEIDPAEFIALYNKFRTKPVYRLGFTLGLNASFPTVLTNYYVGNEAVGNGKYTTSLAFSLYASFEKDITDKITLAPELGYVSRAYSYSNSNINALDSLAPGKLPTSQIFQVSQQWLDLNVIGQYKMSNKNWQTYVGFGPGVSMLLSSSNLPNTLLSNGFTVTGPSEDDTNSYNKLAYSLIATAGVKYRIGDIYFTANVRYQFGISNVINNSTRSNPQIAYSYQGVYNDYRMSNLGVNAGVIYPIFKPKKLIK